MDRILIILKKENGPRASSAPALGLNTIIFKCVYLYMQQISGECYRTIGPLVHFFILAGNKDNHNISDGFEFQPDPTSDCGISCPFECLKNHYIVLWPL